MPAVDQSPRIAAVDPAWACPGGLVILTGTGLTAGGLPPSLFVGDDEVRPVFASPRRIGFRVPRDAHGGRVAVRVGGVDGHATLVVARTLTTGLHQVDNPVFDREGRLYVTYSGSRGQQVPVSIFRVHPSGARESFSSAIVNPTSMVFGPDDALYVSSRFEGVVYRVAPDGGADPFVGDVGVACGLAFDRDGVLYVGDRSGTIFRVRPGKHPEVLTTLPPSIAAYHLAAGADGALFVSGPTLTTYDHVYRVAPDGHHEVFASGFGRPQGLVLEGDQLLVADALAGSSAVHRLGPGQARARVVAGEGLIGLAFDPHGGLVVSSNDTVYRFDDLPGVSPLRGPEGQ